MSYAADKQQISFIVHGVIVSGHSDDSAVDVSQMEKLWDAHASCAALLHCQLVRTVRLVRRFPITDCTYVFRLTLVLGVIAWVIFGNKKKGKKIINFNVGD